MVGAASVFMGVVSPWWMVAVLAVAALVALRRFVGSRAVLVMVLLMVGGAASGSIGDARIAAELSAGLPDGQVTIEARVLRDPIAAWDGVAVVGPKSVDGTPWSGPKLAAVPLGPEIEAGDTVWVRGMVSPGPRRVRTDLVTGTLRITALLDHRPSSNPLITIGNRLRERVRTVFGPTTPATALTTGLLVGDTSGIPAAELNDLRRSGLSHYVAVSGSNVAMFLLAWWFVGSPLAVRPRLRVAYAMVGLAVFAVATRWEPSVIRASVMAAVPLLGGLVGAPVDPWMALGTAAGVLLLVSADLATSVGFMLSVLATAGVLIGVGAVRGRKPAWLWVPLAATAGAQVAVSPLLLAVFGSIPLAAPATNLVAAPVVSFTSLAATVSTVVPFSPLVAVSLGGSRLVLEIARIGAGGPQLGVAASLVMAGVGLLVAIRPVRLLGFGFLVIIALATTHDAPTWPHQPMATVLDVGQGDAILLQDPSGSSLLVDGGSDPFVLDSALRRHGVRSVDLVVVTHGDLDHVGGLVELVGSGGAGSVWIGSWASRDGPLRSLLARAELVGTPVRTVDRGTQAQLGSFSIQVLGPGRRYKSDNDGSVVLLIQAGRSILLPGDVEAVAQDDLPPVRPDVLVVPHHGSATTDLAWLAETVQDHAVLSYGQNRYGHPHPEVISLLSDLEVTVRHTALEGDVVIPLGGSP